MSNRDHYHGSRSGAVYTMTNAPAGNRILAFRRHPGGGLAPAGSFPTGGYGTGAGLGSQGAVALSPGGRFLLAVNAASDQVTAFAVGPDGLELLNVVRSGGRFPVSVAACGGFAYVANAGGTPSIAGFALGLAGLVPIPGAVRPLGPGALGPAQVQFSPACNLLVLTERFSGAIDTFTVDGHGRVSGPAPHPSQGTEPLGFAFIDGARLVVCEAGSDVATLYGIAQGGGLQPLVPPVPVRQRAPRRVATTPDGRYVYVANAGSGSITGFRLDGDTLALLDADGVTAVAGGPPADLAVAGGGRFLYGLNGRGIGGFRIGDDGGLQGLTFVPVPPTAAGLAAR